jgi:hypothetical protein
MNRRIISLLKHLEPHGVLAAALSSFFLVFILLFFLLHDFGLLAGFLAILFLCLGSVFLWAYLSRLQKH